MISMTVDLRNFGWSIPEFIIALPISSGYLAEAGIMVDAAVPAVDSSQSNN